MIRYIISRDTREPAHLRVDLELQLDIQQSRQAIEVFLPEWRPGRYELGHFSRNLRGLVCSNMEGLSIKLEPTGRASWRIHPEGHSRLHLSYLYRADQPDAGGCYVDDQLLYVNPVHCCLYTREHRDQALTAQIITPKNWIIACGLPSTGDTIAASSYDEWVDMPLMASPHIIHHSFEHKNLTFNLWMCSQTQQQLTRYQADLCRIVDAQLEIMGPLPVNAYHFMLLALPYSKYHGVEHRNSSMMVLGPDSEIYRSLYPELLGLSAHELFHTWNVKYIKPNDLMRYDYQHENYSPLGYVYEGFTTYYGDLSLLRSSIFDWHEYAHEVDVYLNRHLRNYGREIASLRDSSLSTWVDGYGDTAAPHRSVNIYAEGMLSAFILDLQIRRISQNQHALDDLMRYLRGRADHGQGYDEGDMIDFLAATTGYRGFQALFEQLYHTPVTLIAPLNQALDWIGCGLHTIDSEDECARSIGLQLIHGVGAQRVIGVAPGSAADRAGIRVGNQVTEISVLNETWTVKWTNCMLKNYTSLIQTDEESWFSSCKMLRLPHPSQEQNENYLRWSTSTRA